MVESTKVLENSLNDNFCYENGRVSVKGENEIEDIFIGQLQGGYVLII